jgi:protein gp37
MDLVGSPFPNVWLGTSIERQKEADERVPALLSTPAAVRFVSAEPLLGPLDMKGRGWLPPDLSRKAGRLEPPYLDWVIVGGESATDAKPMNPAWVRSLRDQCAGSVPFLFKQWGSWRPNFGLKNHHARVWPDGSWSHNVGKGVAGRLLDGREHNGMPARWAEA